MKVAKIFAGMSALALAASMASVTVSAEEAVSGSFYPASYDVTYVYSGADIAAIAGDALIDPSAEDVKDKKAQLVGYTNKETGNVDYYNLGFNIQVGHMTNAKLTIEVNSSTNNIYDGNGGVGSGYMYTVQLSWNGDSPKDDEKGWKKYEYDEKDGSQVMAWGACDINNMSTGPGKYNGEWAQISLTDTDVSALTFTVHVDCSESTWEYHPYSEEDENSNVYQVFSMTAGTVKPNNVDGSLVQETDKGFWSVVSTDEINKQIPGGKTSGKDDSSSSTADSSSTTSSSSSSTSSTSSTTSSGSGKSGGTSTSKASGGTTTTGGSTTAASEAASDNTENAASGAAAGVGLAIAALAGAAIVVSRKK